MSDKHDVIVIGAGMVGASAALALARNGFTVAVIERQVMDAETWQAGDAMDLRVSAISPASQKTLSRLGVWSDIRARRVCDYEHMRVWHENGESHMHFSCAQVGAPLLGSIVENGLIQSVLLRQLELLDNVTLYAGQSIESLRQSGESVQLSTSAGHSMQAQLLLAADGRQSAVRGLLRVAVHGGAYDQTAIVANIETEKPHQFTAWQRFLHTGPVALLPLGNGQSSIVWSADTPLANELLQLSRDEFMQRLGEATEFMLGDITDCSARAGFALNWHAIERWLNGRVLFIGDAAHGVHPLAGQGVNLGFGDVALLAQLLEPGQAVYRASRLRRFERQRKAESVTAMHLFSGLKKLYANTNPLLCFARDLGMLAVERNALLKRRVIQSAMHNMA